MKNLFQYVLDNYFDGVRKVDNTTPIYQAVVKDIPSKIRKILNRDKDLLVKGSIGKGFKTDYPWVAIFNKNITSTAHKGIYIVYLFKRDMSGFYLSLCQGITHFDDLYKKNKYKAAELVAKYYQNEINDDIFLKDPINLCASKGDLGYGYMKANIISKYYSSNNFDNEILEQDLLYLLKKYDYVLKHFDSRSYDSIISAIVDFENFTQDKQTGLTQVDEAIESISKSLDPDGDSEYGFNRTLTEVTPMIDRTKSFERITKRIIRKTDFVKKAQKDAKTGLLGEKLVLEYEKNRLESIGLNDYVDKIKHVSLKSDYFGYDIQSFDIIDGEIKEIQIEVKTTSLKIDTEFQVSKNEVETSEELKDTYFIYRIYDANNIEPKVYRVRGSIKENFELNPITYMARLKELN